MRYDPGYSPRTRALLALQKAHADGDVQGYRVEWRTGHAEGSTEPHTPTDSKKPSPNEEDSP